MHRVVHEAVTLLNEHRRNEFGKNSEHRISPKGARLDIADIIVQNVVKALYCFKGRDDQERIIPDLKAFDRIVKDLFSREQPLYSLASWFNKPEIVKNLFV